MPVGACFLIASRNALIVFGSLGQRKSAAKLKPALGATEAHGTGREMLKSKSFGAIVCLRAPCSQNRVARAGSSAWPMAVLKAMSASSLNGIWLVRRWFDTLEPNIYLSPHVWMSMIVSRRSSTTGSRAGRPAATASPTPIRVTMTDSILARQAPRLLAGCVARRVLACGSPDRTTGEVPHKRHSEGQRSAQAVFRGKQCCSHNTAFLGKRW